ncbi:MAG: hypothetical protein Q4G02_01465 [bacterium]|nr:hypothetical protein [bacterium]
MAKGFWKELFARFTKTNRPEAPTKSADQTANIKPEYVFVYLEGHGRRLGVPALAPFVQRLTQDYFARQVIASGQPLVAQHLSLSIKTLAELKRLQRDYAAATLVFWLVCEGEQTTMDNVLSVREIPTTTLQELLDSPEIDDNTLLGPLVKNHQ